MIRNLQKFKYIKKISHIALSTVSSKSSEIVTERMEKFDLPKRLQGGTPSVWVEYGALAMKYKPLNLGQGFPDFEGPSYITDALAEVAKSSNPQLHQYTRGHGHPRLVTTLAQFYSHFTGRDINSLSEVLVTSGAYEALYCSILGHIDEGDEVIIIEPFFDCYEPMVKMAGGIPKFISLKPKTNKSLLMSSDWVLNESELQSLFNEKTKMIILNTPHNPSGKVFNRTELELIAKLCKKWNVVCLSDEVYEFLVFDECKHIRICTLPDMWERTITIGSAGKAFSVTGWKIGWAYGPENLIKNLQLIHQNCVYTCPTPFQEVLARCLEFEIKRLDSPECYFNSLPKELQEKRNYMANFLHKVGMKPTIPEGGYFMLADWTYLGNKLDLSSETDKYLDYKFTKWMTKNLKFQGIPTSAFYSERNKAIGENYVRYCFMKKQETLDKASQILREWEL